MHPYAAAARAHIACGGLDFEGFLLCAVPVLHALVSSLDGRAVCSGFCAGRIRLWRTDYTILTLKSVQNVPIYKIFSEKRRNTSAMGGRSPPAPSARHDKVEFSDVYVILLLKVVNKCILGIKKIDTVYKKN
jgi:hypothetical protein